MERTATASLIAHLAELESRNLHLAHGFRSLFGYCRVVLHCSEHEAYNRMEAVHAARRFPVILPLLAEGLLHLTAVRLLAPHLRDEDHLALLGGAIHKSKREVLKLVARWFPLADEPSSVRRLPAQAAASPSAPTELPAGERKTGGGTAANRLVTGTQAPAVAAPAPLATSSQPPRPAVAPLSADRYRVTFTASEGTIEKLERAKALLSHSVPAGDVGEIFARALDALLEKAARRKHAATDRPRRVRPLAPASRAIPAAVEREVWARDEGQCAFEGHGRRCTERSFLEFHHVTPWAVGGAPSRENVALRCRAHNAYEAAVYFGPIRAAMEGRGADSFGSESGRAARGTTMPDP